MKGKPLIIFDYDGVLVDTTKFLEEQMRVKLKELGCDISWSGEEMVNLFDENIIVALIGRGLAPRDMCAIWEHMQKVSRSADIRLCDGVTQMLDRLSPKCSMAIISSNSTEAIHNVLGRLGVLRHFFMVSGGDEELGKVERMRKCMQSCDAGSGSTYYVGDTVGDIKEAHEAGISAVAAAWGMHTAERLAGARPEMIVRKPAELVDFVEALSPQPRA